MANLVTGVVIMYRLADTLISARVSHLHFAAATSQLLKGLSPHQPTSSIFRRAIRIKRPFLACLKYAALGSESTSIVICNRKKTLLSTC